MHFSTPIICTPPLQLCILPTHIFHLTANVAGDSNQQSSSTSSSTVRADVGLTTAEAQTDKQTTQGISHYMHTMCQI